MSQGYADFVSTPIFPRLGIINAYDIFPMNIGPGVNAPLVSLVGEAIVDGFTVTVESVAAGDTFTFQAVADSLPAIDIDFTPGFTGNNTGLYGFEIIVYYADPINGKYIFGTSKELHFGETLVVSMTNNSVANTITLFGGMVYFPIVGTV